MLNNLSFYVLILILLFSCNISFPQNSQYKNGAIYGRVSDSEDKTFELSRVTILIEETNQKSKVDQNGFYYIKNVKPGNYNLVAIKSPIVGTFYAKPSPDSEPFVEIGSNVGPQTVVCIIEAMKVMNEIKAETSGTIVESFVSDGQAVEYGQVLFKVKPD